MRNAVCNTLPKMEGAWITGVNAGTLAVARVARVTERGRAAAVGSVGAGSAGSAGSADDSVDAHGARAAQVRGQRGGRGLDRGGPLYWLARGGSPRRALDTALPSAYPPCMTGLSRRPSGEVP
ncbi:hypothetical protein [Sorangium sp. So ce1151]|uniref:hypothetical protein n=1 Tax=Sorangium sp. So ce1151 TaxID=3133332 RepID=UPI003F60089E